MNPQTQRITKDTAFVDRRLIEAGCLQEHIDRFREFCWSIEYLRYIADFGHDSREEVIEIYKREVRGR